MESAFEVNKEQASSIDLNTIIFSDKIHFCAHLTHTTKHVFKLRDFLNFVANDISQPQLGLINSRKIHWAKKKEIHGRFPTRLMSQTFVFFLFLPIFLNHFEAKQKFTIF